MSIVPGDGPILIQWLNLAGEWEDKEYTDPEKAGRLIGWGENHKHYRAVHAESREPVAFGSDPLIWFGFILGETATLFRTRDLAELMASMVGMDDGDVFLFTRNA